MNGIVFKNQLEPNIQNFGVGEPPKTGVNTYNLIVFSSEHAQRLQQGIVLPNVKKIGQKSRPV